MICPLHCDCISWTFPTPLQPALTSRQRRTLRSITGPTCQLRQLMRHVLHITTWTVVHQHSAACYLHKDKDWWWWWRRPGPRLYKDSDFQKYTFIISFDWIPLISSITVQTTNARRQEMSVSSPTRNTRVVGTQIIIAKSCGKVKVSHAAVKSFDRRGVSCKNARTVQFSGGVEKCSNTNYRFWNK